MATTPTPLQRTASEFPTDYWNDSCNEAELTLRHRATARSGATSNPTIVGTVMKQEYDIWAPRVQEIAAENPTWTDQQVTWQVIEEMAIRGWKMLEPIWQANHGQKGRLSIQINPTFNRSVERMVEQARHFDTLAPNVQIKFPAIKAGIEAMEAGHRGRHQHQRHGLLHGAPGAGGGRGHGARPGEARGRRRGHLLDGADLHHHDRPHRRLGEGRRTSATASPSTPLPPTGPASPSSSAPPRSSRSAATARACWPPPTATTCTGPSSSAAMSP